MHPDYDPKAITEAVHAWSQQQCQRALYAAIGSGGRTSTIRRSLTTKQWPRSLRHELGVGTMSEKTGISWTDRTFNIAWGCVEVSPGCDNCYARELSLRYGHDVWGAKGARRTFGAKHWNDPMRWNKAAQERGETARVFSSSMCDIFEDHPTIRGELPKLWDTIRRTPWLDWQLLTKRAGRIKQSLPSDWGDGYPNVWLGVSVENQDYLWRAETLRHIPAMIHFISYEPALGPLAQKINLCGIEWVIFGGESGNGSKNFRAQDTQWARDMYVACGRAGSAFFYKQSAAIRTEMGTLLDGQIVHQFPIERRTHVPELITGAARMNIPA